MTNPASGEAMHSTGYYGRPVVKPPVWTWEVPAYFFVGGLGGMAAAIALAALVAGEDEALLRASLAVAVLAGLVSPVLLVLDLGRPARFLNMLRVFKWRSPMSVGAWTLAVFGSSAVASLLVVEFFGASTGALVLRFCFVGVTALSGVLLAVYTGVLLGATAIPVWIRYRRFLPVHFGIASLGSAAAVLELAGFVQPELRVIGLVAALAETVLGLRAERTDGGPVGRPLREGPSGRRIRAGVVIAGPVSLVLRLSGQAGGAASTFLIGALVSRYGWVAAGRASALDPQGTFALERENP